MCLHSCCNRKCGSLPGNQLELCGFKGTVVVGTDCTCPDYSPGLAPCAHCWGLCALPPRALASLLASMAAWGEGGVDMGGWWSVCVWCHGACCWCIPNGLGDMGRANGHATLRLAVYTVRLTCPSVSGRECPIRVVPETPPPPLTTLPGHQRWLFVPPEPRVCTVSILYWNDSQCARVCLQFCVPCAPFQMSPSFVGKTSVIK